MDISRFNQEAEIGMHPVGTEWQGLTENYEVTMEDHYGFSRGEDTKNVFPLGVQSMGEASSMLPPYMAGAGSEPEGLDPYQGKRDASNISGNAERCTWKMDNVYSEGPEEAFAPCKEQLYSPWTLGENDLQSLFVELHENDYLEALDVAMNNLEAEGTQPFMHEWQVQEIVRSKEKEFECWTSEQFISVRAEDNWSEAQLAEPSYVLIADSWYQYKDWTAKWNRQLSEAGVMLTEDYQCHDSHLSLLAEPELIMAVD